MRLRLLQQRRYPPYSKWLGTAHAALPGAGIDLDDLCGAYEDTGRRQNALGLADTVEATRRAYFDRPYQVIDAGRYAAASTAAITDPAVAALPPVGGIDQYVDSTDVLTRPDLRRAVAAAVLGTGMTFDGLPSQGVKTFWVDRDLDRYLGAVRTVRRTSPAPSATSHPSVSRASPGPPPPRRCWTPDTCAGTGGSCPRCACATRSTVG